MTRVAWLTDIHLNFVEPEGIDELFDSLLAENPDAVLLGGDIGESSDVAVFLQQFSDRLDCPTYFVLGNHDFYHSSIPYVRKHIARLAEDDPRLTYLTAAGSVQLSAETALIGHDGWADGREENFWRSEVMLNDYMLIEELRGLITWDRLRMLMSLGDEAAEHIARVLPEALATHRHVLLLTHTPPLREACWHQGQVSDDQWAPHFVCAAMGRTILEIMRDHPEHRLTVLCGHTHGAGYTQPLPNLEIFTGGAEYRQPAIQRMWEV